MYLADYHTHSKYSFDGCEELSTMCEAAIKRGLSEIAVTDHMDMCTGLPYGHMVNVDRPGGELFVMKTKELYDDLQETKARYEGRLKVKIGTELGTPYVNKDAADAFFKDYGDKLDFVIGSVHNMENDLDVCYYDYGKIDVPAMYDRYVDKLIELARMGCFDVCGHLTYPLRYYAEKEHKILDLHPYMDKFEVLFKCLIEGGRGIEVNVSGLYKPMQDIMPTRELVRMYKDCGGEIITIGSDAHKAEYIGYWQKEARELLNSMGIHYITVFTKRKPEFISIK